ncbi:pyridoxamine 5'-phosphate oxidase family protein [Arthrobacter sp. H5]|uniref:pyridoxamine 5'-phosphate oxidase family protein n=1 Tax=Arthrobacter sp. H5 TaxID=1267973 RepID=UPI0004861375|nr:pyridoxamine 5'-phosphate oxidase family protein [Arthrobacter sp. H5]
MTDNKPDLDVEELTAGGCWELLRAAVIGRLAVWVDGHPDIFPLNYTVDHGTVVFRTRDGTKLAGALSDAAVALEIDGYNAETSRAWSVVVKGRAEEVQGITDLMDTVDLPLFPWQAGEKNRFVRINPTIITGRHFPVADPEDWRTTLSDVRRSPAE